MLHAGNKYIKTLAYKCVRRTYVSIFYRKHFSINYMYVYKKNCAKTVYIFKGNAALELFFVDAKP